MSVELGSVAEQPASSSMSDADDEVMDLPEDLCKAAEEELGETPEKRKQTVKELKSRIQQMPEGPSKPHRCDAAYCLMYLRHAKFNVDRAFQKITNMAKFLHDHADDVANLCGEEFREFYSAGVMRNLEGRTKAGRRITLMLPNNLANLGISPREFGRMSLRWSVWSVFRMVHDPVMQVHGMCILENFEGFTLSKAFHMQTMSAGWMRLSFYFLQQCAPFRIGGIWVAHQPAFMSFMWALVRPFMGAKLRKRVLLLGPHTDKFLDHVDAEVLPPEFGGTLQQDPALWLEKQINLEHEERKAAAKVASDTNQ